MYEEPLYSQRKIKDFAEILCGFESVLKISEIFDDSVRVVCV